MSNDNLLRRPLESTNIQQFPGPLWAEYRRRRQAKRELVNPTSRILCMAT
jgi:hypothetical protein